MFIRYAGNVLRLPCLAHLFPLRAGCRVRVSVRVGVRDRLKVGIRLVGPLRYTVWALVGLCLTTMRRCAVVVWTRNMRVVLGQVQAAGLCEG